MLLLSLAIVCVVTVSAQSSNVAGIYKTESDYVNHKLSYSYECASKTGSIRVNDFFSSPTVVVKADGKKYSLLKSEIFGYQDCNNKNYRFYNGKVYEIVDTLGFYIYTTLVSEQTQKASFPVKKYFFSVTASAAPQALTVQQLEDVFAANTKFRYAVAAQFTSNSKLTDYDSFLHCYKLKYLFTESLK